MWETLGTTQHRPRCIDSYGWCRRPYARPGRSTRRTGLGWNPSTSQVVGFQWWCWWRDVGGSGRPLGSSGWTWLGMTRRPSRSLGEGVGLSSPRPHLGLGERCRTCRQRLSIWQRVLPLPASFSFLRSPFGELAAPARFFEQPPQSSFSSRPSPFGETAAASSGRLRSFSPCFWLRPSTFFLQLVSLSPTVGSNCSY